MAAILPKPARIVFTILEPISLVAGTLAAFVAPHYFVDAQIPKEPKHPLLPTEHIVALQLGDTYLILAMLGVFILNTTTDPRTVRAYIWALLLGDIGHVTVTGRVLGLRTLFNITSWNAMTWGNVGFTIFLFTWRVLYLTGHFGPDRDPEEEKAKNH